MTPEDAEKMVNRFQSALHAMRLFSTVMADCRRHGHPLPRDDGSTREAEAAGKALIAALSEAWEQSAGLENENARLRAALDEALRWDGPGWAAHRERIRAIAEGDK